MLQSIVFPRTDEKLLTGWLLVEPALPHREIRFFRALLSAPSTDEERAALLRQAEDVEQERHVRLEVLVRRDAA